MKTIILIEWDKEYEVWKDNMASAYCSMKEELGDKGLIDYIPDEYDEILSAEGSREEIMKIAEKHGVPISFVDRKYRVDYEGEGCVLYISLDGEPIYFEDIEECDLPEWEYQECEDYSLHGYSKDYTVLILERRED